MYYRFYIYIIIMYLIVNFYSDKYKNSGSLISPIIGEATKNLYRNPLIKGMDSAFRESNTVLESILAQPNGDVKSKLESFKSTLQSYFE